MNRFFLPDLKTPAIDNLNDCVPLLTYRESKFDVGETVISKETVSLDSNRISLFDKKERVVHIIPLSGESSKISISRGNTENVDKSAAESAILNTNDDLLAFRSEKNLKIFNVDTGAVIKEHTWTDNSTIQYWEWVSRNQITIVSTNGVFLWEINCQEGKKEGNNVPKFLFQKKHLLVSDVIYKQIKTDRTKKWFSVFASKIEEKGNIIFPEENLRIRGIMQLYSLEKDISQPIDANVCCFIDYFGKDGDGEYSIQLISICSKTENGGKLFIMPLPTSSYSNSSILFKKLHRNLEFEKEEYPLELFSNDKQARLFLFTSIGNTSIINTEDGNLLYKIQVTCIPIIKVRVFGESFIGINSENAFFRIGLFCIQEEVVEKDSKERLELVLSSDEESNIGIQRFQISFSRNEKNFEIPFLFLIF